jgi:trk system potassium uptake protein TrkA
VVFGAGQTGVAIARVLIERGRHVRLIEPDGPRAHRVAELLPQARVFHATGFDREFLERERIGRCRAAVFAAGDDSRNLYGAVLAKLHGVAHTIAVLEDPAAAEVLDAAGVDATIDPGDETAELMVRFAADPRTHQVVMLEDDRFEVRDIEVRSEGGARETGDGVVGAILRDGRALFPDGEPDLRPGDRAIVLSDSERAAAVERAL